MRAKFHEKVTRSIIKAITFRILILTSDAIIVFAITHKYVITLEVLFFSNLASTIFYVLHERFWDGIRWGRVKRVNTKMRRK